MSKLEELKQLREISSSVYRFPKLLATHPELTLIREIINEVEEKILRRGRVTRADRREVST
jgi:hypothetical protein